jgi:hypothetical protein
MRILYYERDDIHRKLTQDWLRIYLREAEVDHFEPSRGPDGYPSDESFRTLIDRVSHYDAAVLDMEMDCSPWDYRFF